MIEVLKVLGWGKQFLYQPSVLKGKLLGWALPLPHPEPPVLVFFPKFSEPLPSVATQN